MHRLLAAVAALGAGAAATGLAAHGGVETSAADECVNSYVGKSFCFKEETGAMGGSGCKVTLKDGCLLRTGIETTGSLVPRESVPGDGVDGCNLQFSPGTGTVSRGLAAWVATAEPRDKGISLAVQGVQGQTCTLAFS
mmetsp:Transcript_41565/g.117617  ORF Transcript_41565/g.117617 Transcript_41565/m.117617 type:complete len:138 (+) Transcript_41565:102-515(+)